MINLVKVLNFIGLLLLGIIWIVVLMNYSKLPDIIPVHFGITGEPDKFGDKILIFTLPIIYSLLFFGFSILIKKRENNIFILNYLRAMIGILFLLIVMSSINISFGVNGFLTGWIFPVLIILIVVPVLIYIYINRRQNKKGQ